MCPGGGVNYVYNALNLIAIFGGPAWCILSIAFRWRTVTHKYGRHELYFWFVYINLLVSGISTAAIVVLWEIQQKITSSA